MRSIPVLLSLAAALPAQRDVFVPDANADMGTCNAIPFGSTSPTSSFADVRCHFLLTAAELGGPGLITDLGFAPCGTGPRVFDSLRITISHTTQSRHSATFATNLPNPQVVLDVQDFVWEVTEDVWNPLGLQQPFAYDGQSNLTIEVLAYGAAVGGTFVNGTGFRRSSSIPRTYALGIGMPPPATATTVNNLAGSKINVRFELASSSRHGVGCAGVSGVVPSIGVGAEARLGSNLVLDSTGPANQVFVTNFGVSTRPPFPLGVGPAARGCRVYTDFSAALPAGAFDAAGTSSSSTAIPATPALLGGVLFAQNAVIDQGASGATFGLSNYVRVGLGN